MNNGIYYLKDYGKSVIRLKELLEKKGISRNKLCTMIGASYDLVNRYYYNKISRIDLDTISRFCYVLDCDISDIIEYVPAEEYVKS